MSNNKSAGVDEGQQLYSQQQPNLFQKKEVTLHSGQVSDWKIDCDALTDADLECLAYLVSKQIDFYCVHGIPEGGKRFAAALEKYETEKSNIILLVDDVLTTGNSMESMRDITGQSNTKGVVIFARGKCPDWITPIFQLFPQSQQHEDKPQLSSGDK